MSDELIRRQHDDEMGPDALRARPNTMVDLRNFVAPERQAKLDVLPPYQTAMCVDHPARQEVIMHTSAVDRAKGFQLSIAPISIVLAVLAVIVSLAFDNEFFSFASLIIFWAAFCIVYVIGWSLTALMSVEFVSLVSAWRQWNVIDREQAERWAHYRGQTHAPHRPWWIEFKGLIIAGVILTILLCASLVVFAMIMWG